MRDYFSFICNQMDSLTIPDNIMMETLPPYCPDLNPYENLWNEIRDTFFHNRMFKSMNALDEHLVVTSKYYETHSKVVKSIASWAWINYKATICQHTNGELSLAHKGKALEFKIIRQLKARMAAVNRKELNSLFNALACYPQGPQPQFSPVYFKSTGYRLRTCG